MTQDLRSTVFIPEVKCTDQVSNLLSPYRKKNFKCGAVYTQDQYASQSQTFPHDPETPNYAVCTVSVAAHNRQLGYVRHPLESSRFYVLGP